MDERRQIQLERKIIIGMIIDDQYLQYACGIIDPAYASTTESKRLLQWVLGFWDSYKFAPKEKIRDIYEKALDQNQVTTDEGEVIEEILESLSEEQEKWTAKEFDYLMDVTVEYANAAKIRETCEEVMDSLDAGHVEDAISDMETFRTVTHENIKVVIPLKTEEQKKAVFSDALDPVFTYPGALGEMLNGHLFKKGFVVFMAQNKGGKSYILADGTLRAGTQGKKVLMYQAGDMDQIQMERRMAIYAAGKSNLERYCGPLMIPIMDCQHNQTGECEMRFWLNQNEDIFPFDGENEIFFIEKLNQETMQDAWYNNPGHRPCYECLRSNDKYRHNFKGTIWWKKRPRVEPLDLAEYNQLERKNLSRFHTPFHSFDNIRLSTHSNETLSMSQVETDLHILKEEEGFEPELLVHDYLDLSAPDRDTLQLSGRDQSNKVWQRARRISQDWNLLFLSASQSDAQGFDKLLLDRSNFSEDRRKLDHVTGMIGLNMSIDEKILGMLRMNEIVSRETDGTKVVKVMHRLEMGRPILGSFY